VSQYEGYIPKHVTAVYDGGKDAAGQVERRIDGGACLVAERHHDPIQHEHERDGNQTLAHARIVSVRDCRDRTC